MQRRIDALIENTFRVKILVRRSILLNHDSFRI
jgi:hypothetical protein